MTGDHAGQTVSERARCSAPDCWYTLPVVNGLIVAHSAPMTLNNCEGSGRPPTPVPGQAAREAAVKAVAERLSADYDSQRAWVKGDDAYRQAWREDAGELVDIVLAALSAALGQRLAAVLELHQPLDAVHEDTGTRRQVCSGCGTDAGNWQIWPCPTVRAAGGGR